MRVLPPCHRKDPKLRMVTIHRIQKLELQIAALIAADHALFDAGLTHSGRGVAKGTDRRTKAFRDAQARRESLPVKPMELPAGDPVAILRVGERYTLKVAAPLPQSSADKLRATYDPAQFAIDVDDDGSAHIRRHTAAPVAVESAETGA